MEDWSFPVADSIQVNVSGHDAASLGGLPPSFYLNAGNLTGTIDVARIPNLDWAKITNTPTTLIGYGIANAYSKSDIDASLAGKQNISNELTALSTLADTPGFIKKTGDGTYTIDANSYLTSNQNITLSGDVTGSGTTAINVTLPNVVTAGSSAKPTYNAKGLVTGSGSLVANDVPNLDASKITTGILDATRLSPGIIDFSSTPIYYNVTSSFDLNTLPAGGRCLVSLAGNFNVPTGESFWYVECVKTLGSGMNPLSQRAYTYSSSSRPKMALRQNSDGTWSNWQIFDIGGSLSPSSLAVSSATASTSTTTGAIRAVGGIATQGALFAQSLNGQLVLIRYTTATRPVPSAGTLGQVWLNTDTGKIEYVATSTTIQSITSA